MKTTMLLKLLWGIKYCYDTSPFEFTKITFWGCFFQKVVKTATEKENSNWWFMHSQHTNCHNKHSFFFFFNVNFEKSFFACNFNKPLLPSSKKIKPLKKKKNPKRAASQYEITALKSDQLTTVPLALQVARLVVSHAEGWKWCALVWSGSRRGWPPAKGQEDGEWRTPRRTLWRISMGCITKQHRRREGYKGGHHERHCGGLSWAASPDKQHRGEGYKEGHHERHCGGLPWAASPHKQHRWDGYKIECLKEELRWRWRQS